MEPVLPANQSQEGFDQMFRHGFPYLISHHGGRILYPGVVRLYRYTSLKISLETTNVRHLQTVKTRENGGME